MGVLKAENSQCFMKPYHLKAQEEVAHYAGQFAVLALIEAAFSPHVYCMTSELLPYHNRISLKINYCWKITAAGKS